MAKVLPAAHSASRHPADLYQLTNSPPVHERGQLEDGCAQTDQLERFGVETPAARFLTYQLITGVIIVWREAGFCSSTTSVSRTRMPSVQLTISVSLRCLKATPGQSKDPSHRPHLHFAKLSSVGLTHDIRNLHQSMFALSEEARRCQQ